MDNQISTLFMEPTADCDRVIYTPSDFARNNLLYLQEAGRLTATNPHSSHRENLDSFLLMTITSGSGYIEYKNKKHALSSGDVAFIDCKHSYTHTTSNDPWSLSWVHFCGNNVQALFNKYISGNIVFTPENAQPLRMIIKEICLLANSNDGLRDIKIHEKLTSLISIAIDETVSQPLQDKSSLKWHEPMTKIKNYIDTNYHNSISLDGLTNIFYINKFTLIRLFKEHFGMSPVAYLLQLRITKAKELLRFSDISIDEVGWRTGFPDGNYFSRAFKKIEQISPSDYRKRWITKGENK